MENHSGGFPEAVELEDITTVSSSWCCSEQTPWELELLKARQMETGQNSVSMLCYEELLVGSLLEVSSVYQNCSGVSSCINR